MSRDPIGITCRAEETVASFFLLLLLLRIFLFPYLTLRKN